MEALDPKVAPVTGHSGTTAVTCLLVTLSGALGLLHYRSSVNAGGWGDAAAAAGGNNVGSSSGTGSNSFLLGGRVFECVFIYLPVVL